MKVQIFASANKVKKEIIDGDQNKVNVKMSNELEVLWQVIMELSKRSDVSVVKECLATVDIPDADLEEKLLIALISDARKALYSEEADAELAMADPYSDDISELPVKEVVDTQSAEVNNQASSRLYIRQRPY